MKKWLMAMLALGLVTTATAATDFRVLADRQADYQDYHTYHFVNVTVQRNDGRKTNQAQLDRLRDTVAAELRRKGMVPSASAADADVLVILIGGLEAKLEASEYVGQVYFDGKWRLLPPAGEPGTGAEPPDVPLYNQASLRIDLKDRRRGIVVWRALLSDLVKLPVPQQQLQDALDQAFAEYPPAPTP